MEDNRGQRNNLEEMKLTASGILARIHSNDTVDVQSAMTEYSTLVNRFYQENEEIMALQQHEAECKGRVDE